jgi:cytochrome c peroxidase
MRPRAAAGILPQRVDHRAGELLARPFNRLSHFSDDPTGRSAWATRHVAGQHRDFGAFKVPSLRNVARIAPYMHDGSRPTLADVVRHYCELDEDRLHVHGERILRRLDLDPGEVANLVACLESLSDGPVR